MLFSFFFGACVCLRFIAKQYQVSDSLNKWYGNVLLCAIRPVYTALMIDVSLVYDLTSFHQFLSISSYMREIIFNTINSRRKSYPFRVSFLPFHLSSYAFLASREVKRVEEEKESSITRDFYEEPLNVFVRIFFALKPLNAFFATTVNQCFPIDSFMQKRFNRRCAHSFVRHETWIAKKEQNNKRVHSSKSNQISINNNLLLKGDNREEWVGFRVGMEGSMLNDIFTCSNEAQKIAQIS